MCVGWCLQLCTPWLLGYMGRDIKGFIILWRDRIIHVREWGRLIASQSFFRVLAYRMSQKMKSHEMEHREAHGHSFTWCPLHTTWELCANCCSWLLRATGKETERVCEQFGEALQRKLVSNDYMIKHEGWLPLIPQQCICCSRPLGFGNKDVLYACDTHCYARSSRALCWSFLLASDLAAEVWFLEYCLLWLLWSRLTAGWLDCSHRLLTAALSRLLSFMFLDPPPLPHLPLSMAICIFWNHSISVYFLLISLILPITGNN